MGDDDVARRIAAAGLDHAVFRSRFAAAYAGTPEAAAAALERFVAGGGDHAAKATLYGRGADDDARRRAAEALDAAHAERRRVQEAVDAALAAVPAGRAARSGAEPEPEPSEPEAWGPEAEAAPAPRDRRRVPVVAAVAAAVVLLPAAYLAGAGIRGTAAPAPTPSLTELPAALMLNGLAEQDRVTYASPGDPRAASFTAGPLLGGYSVRAACLAMQRRPRTVPSATVQLLDPTGRLIASWALRCDGQEHRVPALPPAEFTRHVQIVLDFDDTLVRTASAALQPNLT
ncbi:hypothetical protein QDR37_04790 [Amnibacterium sp. CER49]|uniref:hypothetical protein n=1 Tax=Amnibacterium sp. CER49 TaxID=3039161 RepID=UPI00244D088D|nr:hypothetical protein [Amnibacterium sp. CER49]MDH2443258.1 hypothetical protein [Amnibacterium sp. CER49]